MWFLERDSPYLQRRRSLCSLENLQSSIRIRLSEFLKTHPISYTSIPVFLPSSFLLLVMFLVSLVHHHHPALHTLMLGRLIIDIIHTGGGSIGECGRLSKPSWLLG